MSSMTNEKWKDVAQRVKYILEKEDLTAFGLAKRIEVPGQTVVNIVNGRNYPGLELLVKIVNAFGWVTADWLVMGEEAPGGAYERSLLEVISQQAKTIALLSGSLAAISTDTRASETAGGDTPEASAADEE